MVISTQALIMAARRGLAPDYCHTVFGRGSLMSHTRGRQELLHAIHTPGYIDLYRTDSFEYYSQLRDFEPGYCHTVPGRVSQVLHTRGRQEPLHAIHTPGCKRLWGGQRDE